MEGISATGSILNATWRIATVIYELKAVGEQTRDLLDTTSQVSSTLQHARVLRRQRSGLLTTTEKKWIDDVLQANDRAVGNVAALIEPARVDMQTRFNKVKFLTRGQFVLRDSPKVQYQLGRLGIAAQGLNTVMGVLCNREGSINPPSDYLAPKTVDAGNISQTDLKTPPSYQLVELLDRRRGSAPSRQASRLPLTSSEDQDAELSNYQTLDKEPVHPSNVAPTADMAPNLPTPVTYSRLDQDQYPGSDGLQVVEDYWGRNPWTPSAPDPDVGRADRIMERGPRTPISPMPHNNNELHGSRCRSPTSLLPELDSNGVDHIPYRPPGPSPSSSSATPSWPQQPRSAPLPESRPPSYTYPSPELSTTAASTPGFRQRPDPPTRNPPYPTTAQTYNHQHHHHQQDNHPFLPTRNQPYQVQTPPHKLRTDPSFSSLHTTTTTTHPTTTTDESKTVPAQLQPQPSRSTGRARVRAWLEHQSQR